MLPQWSLRAVPCVLIAVGSAAAGVIAGRSATTIAPGLHVAGVPIRGKSFQEVRQTLHNDLTRHEKTPIILRFAPETGIQRVWRTSARQIGLLIDREATLQAVSRVEPPGPWTLLVHRITGKPFRQDMAPVPLVDERRLRAVLQQIGQTVNRPPQNARFQVLKRAFRIQPDRSGFAMDVPASMEAVSSAWRDFVAGIGAPEVSPTPEDPDTEASAGAGSLVQPGAITVTLPGQITRAQITAESLRQINGLLAAFSTSYGGTGRSRGENIALAARKIDGTLLAPGEIFSYNRVVGPRTPGEGFRLAPVIIRDMLVPGIGGGVCQVSSTLYNAALLADLKIVQRCNHGIPVRYLPPGRDATVVYGAIDLQFQNTTGAPLYISCSARGGRITFRLYGKTNPARRVRLVSYIARTSNGGRTATVYRLVSENGRLVRRERISSDYYRPPAPDPLKVAKRSATRPVVTVRNAPASGSISSPAVTGGPVEASTPPAP
ncbi:MAG: VanW family protein [Chthonomonadaceae bacterium]|nr:VanW family protein [Chthonomonadaceae bacterium]